MALHGSLETIQLADVLTMLAGSGKTGELRVTGPGVDGGLWLETGQLVDYEGAPRREPVDAVFDLLRVSSGTFWFEAGERSEHPGPPMSLGPVLAEATERLDEWREIEEVVPSLDHAVALAPIAPGPEVRLSADDWRVVVAVAGAATVGDVVQALRVGELAACAGLRDLVEGGMLTISAPNDGLTHSWQGQSDPAAIAQPDFEDEPEPDDRSDTHDAPAREPRALGHPGNGSWAQAAGAGGPTITGDQLERAMTFNEPDEEPAPPPVVSSPAEPEPPSNNGSKRGHRIKLRHL